MNGAGIAKRRVEGNCEGGRSPLGAAEPKEKKDLCYKDLNRELNPRPQVL